ncbi:unnamed protein product [Aphanomyces euteiches]|uniref:EF-hand domain-containing protein n=1 Tax=Aphanomyces euteiches TaxID=100861 RepID=A0A6G0WCE6_9STRA|nr:hypothetical protein Ae201684_016677 [Aphanomyces euteiches]KAH9083042.1 hypothetical protein Ae201684P_013943 [Aphanomyces euteiches]
MTTIPSPRLAYAALETPVPELEPTIVVRRTNSRASRHSNSNSGEPPLLPPITVTQKDSVQGAVGLPERQNSIVSNKSNKNDGPTTGKLKFNMGKERSIGNHVKYRPDFKFNMELALRTAVGVLLASMVQTKYRKDNVEVLSNSHEKQWLFFPEWYILGGLSYVATATVFGCGRNIGSTVREIFQQLCGVGVALLYNLVIFSIFQPQVFNTKAEFLNATMDGTLLQITHAFSGSPYWVHQGDFYTILPFIMLFTMAILVLPIENNTKKYALGNNLYFALTIVSPNDFTNPAQPKAFGDDLYKTPNLLKNLLVYMCLGILGACIAQIMLWFPYPIFAIRKLQEQTLTCADTIQDLLNLIVDSYCFKNKDHEHMNFLRLKLKRKFDLATAKHATMTAMLNDVWWEQLVGLHVPLKFKMSVTKPYIELFGSLIENLRAMNQAIQLERYEHLHELFMRALQREVYVIQLKASSLLNEISQHIHDGDTALALKSLEDLEKNVESLLQHFQQTQTRIYKREKPTPKDVEGNIPLNLFLFSLQSYCATLLEFESTFNSRTHKTNLRVMKFVKSQLAGYVDKSKYSRAKLETAAKVWFAILCACFFSVYTFGYSSTTAGTVAYVMGNHIGGSFSVTANRVGGVVAGSIIPSVCLFYICSYSCGSIVAVSFFSNAILFIWVTFSMYVKWKGGFESYAGLVSAYTATNVMLKGCDGCATGTVTPTSSYSNLAQMSLGIVLFIIVELVFCPQSAIGLLRANIQSHMKLAQQSFLILFEQNLRNSGVIEQDTLDEVKAIVQKQMPALLAEQVGLLNEAAFEPLLWKPPFSKSKYDAVLDCCQRLLNNTLVLFKLVTWFKFRVEQRNLTLVKKLDIEQITRKSHEDDHAVTTKDAWAFSTVEVGRAIHDSFDTLHDLFGDHFLYADGDQTALFMQMKEAFRLADTDCSGEIDAEEVRHMLELIFAQSGAIKVDAIESYVQDFMEIVDKDKSGKVSFDEFMDAIEHGLKLEVEVFQHRSKAIALPAPTPSVETKEKDDVVVQVVQAPGDAVPSPQAPITQRLSSQGGGASPITRSHDMLNVDSFSLLEIAQTMRTTYAQWLMEKNRFERVTMEELLLLNCLISGVSGIARNLALLEEMTVQQ